MKYIRYEMEELPMEVHLLLEEILSVSLSRRTFSFNAKLYPVLFGEAWEYEEFGERFIRLRMLLAFGEKGSVDIDLYFDRLEDQTLHLSPQNAWAWSAFGHTSTKTMLRAYREGFGTPLELIEEINPPVFDETRDLSYLEEEKSDRFVYFRPFELDSADDKEEMQHFFEVWAPDQFNSIQTEGWW